MEEILSFFGFTLGASLAIGAVRSVADGSRPVIREMLKTGIRAWDSVATAAAAERDEAARAATGDAAARGRGRRRAEPRKIEIAHS